MKKQFSWIVLFIAISLISCIFGCKEPEIETDTKAPANVTKLTVTAADGNAVLTWKNPTDADFDGVQVSMSPAEGTLLNPVILGKNVTSLNVGSLTSGKEYTFTVKTIDTNNNKSSGVSAKAEVADTSDKTVPADVTELTATNKDASVLLTWTDATDEDIYGYEVTWNKNAPINRSVAMEANSMMVAPGAKGCYISNLTNGTEYAFTVKSVDTSRNKSAGVTKTITPSIIEKSALQIALEPNTTERTNKDVVITVNVTTDAASEIKQITYIEGTESKIDTVLEGINITETKEITATENTTFTVAVTDTAGRRELAFVTVNNIDKTAPTQVANVIPIYSRNDNAIKLDWTNPADKDFAGTEIVYGKTDSEETTTLTFDKNTTSATIENIADDDSEYTIAIKTKDDVGNLSEAKTVTVVAATGAKITSVNLNRTHLDSNMTNRDIEVTISGSNFDLLTSLLVQVTDGSKAETPVTATINKETNTATATVTAPVPAYPTDNGTTYTVKVIVDSTTPAEKTATFVVSKPADVTKISLAQTQIPVGTEGNVTATITGYNFDIRGVTKVKLLDSNNDAESTVEVPLETNTSETEFTVDIPLPKTEGFYTVAVFFDDVKDTTTTTLQVYETTSISEVTIPVAGIDYAGNVLPVTINGKNFTAPGVTASGFTSTGATLTNVTIISDTNATAEVVCPYAVGTTNVTVCYGESSATGTLKVLAAEKCFVVGDVLLTDGTRIKAENVQYGSPSGKTFAVIVSASYGGGVGKAIGLQKNSLRWADGTTGYNTNFTEIQASYRGSSSSGYTFEGDIDGSDNWEYICSIDPEETQDAAKNYPIFNFANTYGTTAGLTGTDYETGWYVPSVAEVYEVYKNKEVIQTSLDAAKGFTLGTSYYWSSSQRASYDTYAYRVKFYDGEVSNYYKDYYYDVFVLQAFNAEQFNKYEYNTEISSVEIPTIAEGFVGEVPVKIKGKDLIQKITVTGLTISRIDYISDAKAIAYATTTGTETETTITVSCGTVSATATLKVLAAEKCFVVGDVLLTDGTRIKAENAQYGIPSDKNAFAVVASAPYGGGTGKAIGLQKNSLKWAPSRTTGYNTNFTEIQASNRGSSSSGYTFEGDLDGSDNWEEICAVDPEGTKDAATNYPIFNFANTYGTTAGLTGTDYETGWYVPSVAEVYEVSKNKEVIQTSLTKAGGFTIGKSSYWSSSQYASNDTYAYRVYLYDGHVSIEYKGVYYDVFVLQAFNAEQFNKYEYNTEISSVEIPTIAEGFVGEVPVKIKGKDLIQKITVTGLTISRIDYFSDAQAIAYATTTGTETETTITVSCGTASATGTLKVLAAEKCFSVGDVLLTDGTLIKAENVQYGLPSGKNAFAVIASAPYGGGTGKAIGLQKSASELMWAPEDTTGYNTNFTEIQASYSGSSSSGYTFEGDIDGSDNWEYICSIDPEGTKDAATNYPIFNFANTYGTTAGLTGTDYETGWYVPSVAEVYEVYKNKDVIQTLLDAVKGFTLGTSWYWSSSQLSSYNYSAYQVNFNDVRVGGSYKENSDDVFVLQAFNAEQINNYEYNTEISSVEIPTIAEGFVGEVPVKIKGKDLIQKITVTGLTISRIDYISDAKAIAYATTTGTETETTITVSCGTASATGTLKVLAAEKCFSVGDVLLTDGTRIKAENAQYGIPSGKNAFAVIVSAPYGGGTGKAIGLQEGQSLMWAQSGTTGIYTYFTEIRASYRGSPSSGYTFEGDIDGSDNWEEICAVDPEGTKDAATNYPIFNFANTYGTTAGLTGTDYETGWYVPSVAEVYEVYKNKDVIQTSLTKAGGFTIGQSSYWSSSQSSSYNYGAYYVDFDDGDVYYNGKSANFISVFVLQSLNGEQINNYEYNTEISSVEIPTIAEGFVGEVPVKITGKDIIQKITVSGLTISRIDYFSDAQAIAYATTTGTETETTITVSCGTASATGTLKVLAAEKCFSVGDVLLTDGTLIKAENVQYGLPLGKNAFAVIVSAPYGGGTGKAIGLQKNSLKWAPSGTTGYNTNFTEIQASYSDSSSSGYTFEGDLDGSDNWEEICAVDPEGTKDAATNYPAFNFANTYGATAGLTGTDYETGWYVPSVAEVYEVYKNKAVIQTSLTKASGFEFIYSPDYGENHYWSSSQYAFYSDDAYTLDFTNGDMSGDPKPRDDNVFVLRALNAEQFNNYEYNTEISSVEIPTIAEGFVGEVPVKITGKELIQKITVSGLTISRIDYFTDAKAIAYATTTGTETNGTTITVSCGESSATTTLKVIEYVASSYEVGDIILTNGTKVSVTNVATYTIDENNKPIGVVAIISDVYGFPKTKVIGLQKSASTLSWARYNTTGYKTKFTNIICTPSKTGTGAASTATFTGDTDGSDNWAEICAVDPEGTANYPIFNFANTYGTTAGLTDTDYDKGWYIPSIAELCEVYKNKEVIQTSLTKASGFTFGSSYYWCSSQHASYSGSAYRVGFDDGYVNYDGYKDYTYNTSVFVLQALTAK